MNPSGNQGYNDTINQQLWSADWSSDGERIAIGGVDSILRIFNAGEIKLSYASPVNSWIHSVKWHHDSKTLAVATLEGVQIHHVDYGTTKKINLKAGSRAIAWNHDGRLLAIGDLNGMIHIADKEGKLLRSVDYNYGPDQYGTSFTSIDWHPHKNIFIATNFEIGLFDSSGRRITTMEHRNKSALMLAVDWHPSGKFFVIGDYGHNWSGEHVPSLLHFWSEDGTYLKAIKGSKAEIRNLAFNKDGSLLASASDVLRIWKSNGEFVHRSRYDGSNYLWGISWNPKGNRIVTSSRQKTIAIWNKKAKLLKRIDLPRY